MFLAGYPMQRSYTLGKKYILQSWFVPCLGGGLYHPPTLGRLQKIQSCSTGLLCSYHVPTEINLALFYLNLTCLWSELHSVFLLFPSYVVVSQAMSHTLTLIVQQNSVEVAVLLHQTWENLAQSQPNPPSQGLQSAWFLVFVSISIICRSPGEKSGLCCELSCQLLCIHTERFIYLS